MAQHLPPLNSLRFFEAAARLGNFRRVAEELHVTPSAVSHSILALETWTGTQLFERTPRGLVLTEPGNSFLPSVTTALGLISDATDQLSGYREANRLSLRAGRRLLIESDLAFGSLVELDLPRVAGQSSYWLIGAGPTFERRETRAFRGWLINEMRSSTLGEGGRRDSPIPGKFRLRCD